MHAMISTHWYCGDLLAIRMASGGRAPPGLSLVIGGEFMYCYYLYYYYCYYYYCSCYCDYQ